MTLNLEPAYTAKIIVKKLLNYFKLITFSVLVLIGIQAPGFVSDYGKNLDARLAESKLSITPFQNTADKHFNGNIDKLINHYNNNGDQVLIEGGESISQVLMRHKLLQEAHASFKASTFASYQHTLLNPIADIRQQAWDSYDFQVLLNKEALLFGLIFALIIMSIVEILMSLLGLLKRRNSRSSLV
ncbi:DUF2937 family protein [Kangiella sp. HZ709]|uniref:DUF2937 family protein n=1 Tax=Kangiella sp. HZ709 TaxID=2666328 RepID=UPI0012AFA3B4